MSAVYTQCQAVRFKAKLYLTQTLRRNLAISVSAVHGMMCVHLAQCSST